MPVPAVLLADTIAEGASCLYLGLSYRRDQKRTRTTSGLSSPPRGVVRRLLSIAVPISAGPVPQLHPAHH